MKFKYKKSLTLYILLAVGFVIATLCFVLNLIKLITNIKENNILTTNQTLSIILCLVLPLIFFAFLIAMIFNSCYTIKNNKLTVNFGFIFERFDVSEIATIEKYNATNKFFVIFKNEQNLAIIIDEKYKESFVDEIKKYNSKIIYIESSEKPM